MKAALAGMLWMGWRFILCFSQNAGRLPMAFWEGKLRPMGGAHKVTLRHCRAALQSHGSAVFLKPPPCWRWSFTERVSGKRSIALSIDPQAVLPKGPLIAGLLCFVTFAAVAADNYATWSYYRPVYLNTTAAGANVSATTLKFPVLVRLNPGNFDDFANTETGGADIRFAKPDGAHLAYQIERWIDGAGDNDTADIWVLADSVYGNDSTELRMYWGKSGAADSSRSGAVFDTANGFKTVWHLNGNFNDATYTASTATNDGTTAKAARIAEGREFDGSNDLIDGNLTMQPCSVSYAFWIKWDGGGATSRDFSRKTRRTFCS